MDKETFIVIAFIGLLLVGTVFLYEKTTVHSNPFVSIPSVTIK